MTLRNVRPAKSIHLHRAELQPEVVGAKAYIGRNKAQPIQGFDQHAVVAERQRDQDGGDAYPAHVAHEVFDGPEYGMAHAALLQMCGVVVNADNPQVRGARGAQAAQQPLRDRPGTDDGHDLIESALIRPATDLVMKGDADRDEQRQAAQEPDGDPWPVRGDHRLDRPRCGEEDGQCRQPTGQDSAHRAVDMAEPGETVCAGEM